MFNIYSQNRSLWQMIVFFILCLLGVIFNKPCQIYLNIHTLESLKPQTNTLFNPTSACSSQVNSQLFYLWGVKYYNLGEFNKAIEHLTLALNGSARSQLIYLQLGQALSRQGLVHQAVEVWQKGNVENYFSTQGHLYLNQQKWEFAIKYYQQSLNINPKNEKALWGIGIAYRNQSLWSDAIQAYQGYLDLRPTDNDVRYNLGLALLQINEISLARAEANQLLKINPQLPLGLLLMGHTYRLEGQFETAIESYKAIEGLSTSTTNYNLLAQKYIGITYLDMKQADQALVVFQSVIQTYSNLNPAEEAEIYFYLSLALEIQGNLEQAIIAIGKAVNLNPITSYQYKLANLYENTQQFQQAQQIYEEILRTYPSDPLATERLNILTNTEKTP